MKDTVFDRKVQKLVNDSGIPKGMKLDTLGMNAQKMRERCWEVMKNFKVSKHLLKNWWKAGPTYVCFSLQING